MGTDAPPFASLGDVEHGGESVCMLGEATMYMARMHGMKACRLDLPARAAYSLELSASSLLALALALALALPGSG